MSEPLQHYVPKFMLRRFAATGQEVVHAFDKHQGKSFPVSTSKKSKMAVVAEREMYDFEFAGVPMTLEPSLSRLETRASEIVTKIIEQRRVDPEWHEDKAALASFLAVQLVRTKATLAMSDDLGARLEQFARAHSVSPEFFEPDPEVGDRANARKAHFAASMTTATDKFAPLLLDKVWYLLETDERATFMLGDHPLVRFNGPGDGVRGKLGLKSKGIQLYFPLSPNLALGMSCPTLLDQMTDGIERIDKMLARGLGDANYLLQLRAETMPGILAMLDGGVISCEPANVEHANSLQVLEAERFIFSATDDFSIAVEMIAEDERVRRGARLSGSLAALPDI